VPLFQGPCLKTALHKSFNILDNFGLYPELFTCVLPGLYQRFEAAIFLGLVLIQAGAGTSGSAIG
jgi:hypothetical protein